MSERTEASPSFDGLPLEGAIEGSLHTPLDLGELQQSDSQQLTLARAVGEASTARDAVFKVQGEMVEELERFRAAMRHELKERKRKLELHDVLLLLGLSAVAGGIAVAFHWAYSLITIGVFITVLSLVPWFRPSAKT